MSNVSTLDLVSLARGVGERVAKVKGLESEVQTHKDAVNKDIAALHSKKAVVGTYKKDGSGCALATAFVDGGVNMGLSKDTMQKTYLPTFKAHVASGKPVGDWNSQRAKKKAQGATKGAKATKEFSAKLATCFRDADFEGFINDLQESFENDEIKTLLEGVKSYLESEGVVIKE